MLVRMRRGVTGAIAALLVDGMSSGRGDGAAYPALDPAHPVIGTLESDPAHDDATNQAGARAVVVGVSWDRFEPREGAFDAAYLAGVAEKIRLFRAGGKLVALD